MPVGSTECRQTRIATLAACRPSLPGNRRGELSKQLTQQQQKLQTQDRERQRLVQQMCDSLQARAQETRRSMERVNQMLQDQTLTRDREMTRDMDQLREHLHASSSNLQETLQTLERIQERLRTRTTTEK
jgi:hypothetical protein